MSWGAAPDAATPAGRRQRRLLLGCALLAGFKLWLVAGDELVARANPMDQLRYLEMAQSLIRGRWLGAYDHLTLIREPAYPAWIALVHLAGLPLRLATEGLLIAAAALFCAALLRAGTSLLTALACFGVIAFEPHSLLVNREALPASIYLPVLLCALAGLVWSVQASSTRRMLAHAGWSGLALGVLWTTRPEKLLPLVAVGVIASFDIVAGLWRGASRSSALRRAAVLAGVPLCGIVIVAGGFAANNQRHYGVFRTTELTAPGYLAANRALLSIEQSAPRQFVPVPRDVRDRAYRVSPAFRELRPTIEGPSWARGVSCNIDGICDDIGGGYFRWLLRDAAASAGHTWSAAAADAFFWRIAHDLEGACRSGALRCHRALSSFLHPYPDTYLSHLWVSLRRVLGTAFGAGSPPEWDAPGDHPEAAPRVKRLFDVMANRREDLTGNGRVSVRGWAVAERDPIERVVLSTTWERAESRADGRTGPPAAVESKRIPFHFEIDKRTRAFSLSAPALVFQRESGATTKIPLFRAIDAPEAHDGVRVTVEAFEETGEEDPLRRAARTALWIAHPLFYAGISALGLLAAAALLLPFRRGRFADPGFGVFLVLMALAAAHFALLTLVDASSFPARSSRYVYPAVPLYGCATLLLVEQGVRNLRRRARADGRLAG